MTEAEIRAAAIRDVLLLMSPCSTPWAPPYTIYPHTNGYSMWFISQEQAGPKGLGTAPLSVEEIEERIAAMKHAESLARPKDAAPVLPEETP